MIVRKRFRRGEYSKNAVSSQPPTKATFDPGNLTLCSLPDNLLEDILGRLPAKLLMQLRYVCKSLNSFISHPIFAKKHHLCWFPVKLLEDILCRLSVKLLMQLRCVCKSWNSLISDPIFAKKHLQLFNQCHFISWNGRFQFWDSRLPSFFNSAPTNISKTRLYFPLDIQHDYYKLIGSCDGLLCFSIEVSIGTSDSCSVMVWNPSIRKSKILPLLQNQPKLNDGNSNTIFGFGYDRVTDNYKVVAFCCCRLSWVCKKVQVHTLGRQTWKTIPGLHFYFPFDYGFTVTKCGIFLKGTVNWLGVTFSPNKSLVILSFDLGNESHQELLPSEEVGVDVCAMNLGVLRDCLCILSHTRTNIHVWLMEDYGNKDSWTKLFVVTYDDIFIDRDPTRIRPLHILKDEQLLLDFSGKLAVYSFRNRTLKILKVRPVGCWFVHSHVYIESLISP